VPVYLDGLGNAVPLRHRHGSGPQVDGPLTAVSFQEGQAVKKGDLLARNSNPRPFYDRPCTRAQAALARDQGPGKKPPKSTSLATWRLHDQGLATQEQLDDFRAQGRAIRGHGQIRPSPKWRTRRLAARIHGGGVSPVDGCNGACAKWTKGTWVHASDPNGIVVVHAARPR